MPGRDCSSCATGLGTVTFGHFLACLVGKSALYNLIFAALQS
ncbi:uncharacterized protein PpBr36_11397 [Pyricularia pennisetigena]|nr:uncharacterized protein PpBr36_11397 [Pyricularia pennisetigena]TLS20342.1 hypothetical protein PpBr36_11397 [Pyricularia pennisetigena]